MINEFKTPRFIVTAFFSITTTSGYFMDKMSSGEYIGVLTAILGAWFTHKYMMGVRGE